MKKWRSDLGVPANKIPSISKHLREQETCKDSILQDDSPDSSDPATGPRRPRRWGWFRGRKTEGIQPWLMKPATLAKPNQMISSRDRWRVVTKWTAGNFRSAHFSWAGRAHKCTSQHLKECEVLTGTFSCPLHVVSTAELIEVPFSETFPKLMLNQIVLHFNTKQWEVSLQGGAP